MKKLILLVLFGFGLMGFMSCENFKGDKGDIGEVGQSIAPDIVEYRGTPSSNPEHITCEAFTDIARQIVEVYVLFGDIYIRLPYADNGSKSFYMLYPEKNLITIITYLLDGSQPATALSQSGLTGQYYIKIITFKDSQSKAIYIKQQSLGNPLIYGRKSQ